MSDNDDLQNLTCPNTAEEFLKMLLINMQSINKRVESMETKFDQFLTKFKQTDQISNHPEIVTIASDMSDLTDNVRALPISFSGSQNLDEIKVTKGVIIPVGDVYLDPKVISNMTQSQVTIQHPDSPPTSSISEPDFIVIQPSSDLIDKLATPDFRQIQTDVRQHLDIAHKALSDNPNTQLLISSLPPRYDSEGASMSTELWNSILVTETFLNEKVQVVPQSGLECREGRKRFERYQGGGFMLTSYGTKLLSKNIVTSIMQVTRSMQDKPSVKIKKTRVKLSKRRM